MSSTLSFNVNGVGISLSNPDPTVTLLEFLRTSTTFTGTKASCTEGGCGACVVLCDGIDPGTGQTTSHSINACLAPLVSLNGKSVTTAEGIGNAKKGYSKIQTELIKNGGSQCGFCTPGMVCSIAEFVNNTPNPTKQQAETRLDGQLCRCTGYRPILDTIKSFAAGGSCADRDIEDLVVIPRPATATSPTKQHCRTGPGAGLAKLYRAPPTAQGTLPLVYYVPSDMNSLMALLQDLVSNNTTYRFVCGNTSVGIYPQNKNIPAQVQISQVPELKIIDTVISQTSVTFGGAVTITRLIDTFIELQDTLSSTAAAFIPTMLKHLYRVGNYNMRNVASWAGNLSMCKIQGFASDLATVLLGIPGCTVFVYVPSKNNAITITLDQFFSSTVDPSDFLLCKLTVPYSTGQIFYRTSKAALRLQNAHALVNASFYAAVSGTQITSCRIVYGAINSTGPMRALKTEALLANTSISENTLATALSSLVSEVSVQPIPAYITVEQPQGKLAYRKSLVSTFFYRFFLAMAANAKVSINPMYTTGTDTIARPVSSGTQTYQVDPSTAPVGQPVAKIEGLKQSSGEAIYVDDIPMPRGGCYGAFVLTTVATGTLVSINSSFATAQIPGGVLITAAQISGTNDIGIIPGEEPLFVPIGGTVLYYGQPVGMFVASTRELAELGAAMCTMKITEPTFSPILTIPQAIAAKSFLSLDFQNQHVVWGDAKGTMPTCQYTATATVVGGNQAHFYMEKQTCLAVTDENGGIELTASTQLPDDLRKATASVLGVSGGQVTVKVRRIGGGYGGKLSRSYPVSIATAVCAQYLGIAVRAQLNIHADMAMTGGRNPFQSTFTVGFNETGLIQALDVTTYFNGGSTSDYTCFIAEAFNEALDSCYFIPNYDSTVIPCKTSLPTNTANRSFGHIQAALVSESVMHAVAEVLNMAPYQVRELNFYNNRNCVTPYGQSCKDSFTLPTIWSQLKTSSNYIARKSEIEAFNAANRWQKKGLAIVPVKYGVGWENTNAVVSFTADGIVNVLIGGVEMGQGVNTKCVQTAAQALGCPMEVVRIADINTCNIPNIKDSGGSVTSGENAEAVRLACLKLVQKSLGPVRATLPATSTWMDVVTGVFNAGLNSQAIGYFYPPGRAAPGVNGIGVDGPWKNPFDLFDYFVFGAACAEVLVDVLTGEYMVSQVDLLYDCGNSMNPLMDIGQCEGAFMFGAGYLTSEETLIAPTGQIVSDGTWEYKPPCSLSVPVKWNVAFLENSPFSMGVMRSKAVGEPPMILAVSIFLAMREAMLSARTGSLLTGSTGSNTVATNAKTFKKPVTDRKQIPKHSSLALDFIAPLSIDRIQQNCGTDTSVCLTLQ